MTTSSKKQILFIHQNFPGQYRYLSHYFADHPEWDAWAVGERKNVQRQWQSVPKNIKMLGYDMPDVKPENISRRLLSFAGNVIRADALEAMLLRQKQEGLDPDIILAHPGWGEGLYLKELFPKAKLVYFFEYYFSTTENNIFFDPEVNNSLDQQIHYRMSNTASLIGLDAADVGICPTQWQWSTFPKEYRDKIKVIHDGVDTTKVKPQPVDKLLLPKTLNGDMEMDSVELNRHEEIISYSVRNLEPSRGFHRFMRLLPKLQKLRPNARFVIVGGDEKSYSPRHRSGKSWREIMLEEVQDQLDMDRIIFAGKLPYTTLLQLFSITRLHLYWTTPFVLSWSLMEAMACKAPILASRTSPVEEVIEEGRNGCLFDFFSEQECLEKVSLLMNDADLRARLGEQAREDVIERYDLNTHCLPQHLQLIERLSN